LRPELVTVSSFCLLSDTKLGREWRWNGGAYENPLYRDILAKFQDNKESRSSEKIYVNVVEMILN
jgi:hypothetical protein